MKNLIIPLLLAFGISCCQEPFVETKDYVFTCDLKGSEYISDYDYFHSQEGVWPEVKQACEKSGAVAVKVFRQELRLVLIITLPEDLPFDRFDSLYNGSSDKMALWAEKMGMMQTSPPGMNDAMSWVPMKTVFRYEK